MKFWRWVKSRLADIAGLVAGFWFIAMLVIYTMWSSYATSAPIKASLWMAGAFAVITFPFAFAILTVFAFTFKAMHVSRFGKVCEILTWILAPFFVGFLSWLLGQLLVGDPGLILALTVSGAATGIFLRAAIEKTSEQNG